MSGDNHGPGARASFEFPVEAGHILLFARALGDDDPRYRDPGHETTRQHGGVQAPPTFVAAAAHFDPSWRWRPRPGQPWTGSGAGPGHRSPEPAGGTGLHAEQHYEYHLPVRPGDVLTVEREAGESWEKVGRSGRRLLFTTEISQYRNQRGELAVTARMVRVVAEDRGLSK